MQTDDRWAALYQRWWIDYNPLALASAALVLGGLTLLGKSAVFASGLSMLAPSALAELYAISLIGAAALLFRNGRRRAAVILVLLAVVFQGDLTLHVETSPYLAGGALLAAAWFAVFALKLLAMARALRLRPARSTLLVLLVGGAGLAAWPTLMRIGDCSRGVSLWLFAVVLAGLHTGMPIQSEVALDVRGRRAIRFTWLLWTAALLVHGLWWVGAFHIDPTPWLAGAALLATRWCKREAQHWALVTGVLGLAIVGGTDTLPVIAVMAAATLAYTAWVRPPTVTSLEPSPSDPYRATGVLCSFEAVRPGSRVRLALGALFSLYLAVWSAEGVLGDQPLLALVGLSLVVGHVAHRCRKARYLLPLLPLYGRLLVRIGWLSAPEGSLQWGALALVLGFAALGASMIVQLRAPVSVGWIEPSSAARVGRSAGRPSGRRDRPR